MKYLKENTLSVIKHQLSDVAKAKDCSQLLIDSLKDQINSLQNEIRFLREELKVKNHLLEITITSKKIDSSTIYPSRQQIDSQTQKISDEKKCCLININGNNNITIKPLTRKDSVDITKNNAREERAIATNKLKTYAIHKITLIIVITLICRKTQDKETIASLIRAPKMGVIVKILNSNKKSFTSSQKICVHRKRQYDKKNRSLFTYQFY